MANVIESMPLDHYLLVLSRPRIIECLAGPTGPEMPHPFWRGTTIQQGQRICPVIAVRGDNSHARATQLSPQPREEFGTVQIGRQGIPIASMSLLEDERRMAQCMVSGGLVIRLVPRRPL